MSVNPSSLTKAELVKEYNKLQRQHTTLCKSVGYVKKDSVQAKKVPATKSKRKLHLNL